ncbi:MAG: class I SAM-dependent methyltransferase [Nitrospirae bacterium]|nr:class I SAM-dependent methyltransferase [Nitrospirota bacterium]
MGKNSFFFSNERYQIEDDFYRGLWQVHRKTVVLNMIGSGKTVLDAGCYDGSYLIDIKKQNNDVYGIDASINAVEKARGMGLKVKQGSLEERWDYEDNTFDVVYSGEVIEHIIDTDFYINEIFRVLKAGGYFVVTTPNLACLSKRFLLLIGRNPYQEASFSFPAGAVGHMREYTFDLLRDYMLTKGFSVIESKSDIVSIPYCPAVIQRFLGITLPMLGRSIIVKFQLKK